MGRKIVIKSFTDTKYRHEIDCRGKSDAQCEKVMAGIISQLDLEKYYTELKD